MIEHGIVSILLILSKALLLRFAGAHRVVSTKTCSWLGLVGLLCAWPALSTRLRAADGSQDTHNGELVVRVVDEKGVACSGAHLTLFAVDLETHAWTDMNRDAISDASGSVRYDRLHSEYAEYVVRAKTDDGQIGVRSCLFRHGVPRLTADLIVQHPVATTVRLHDQTGKPITGTSLWVITHIGVNGILRSVAPQTLTVFGAAPTTSDGAGNLTLPDLPPGKLYAQFVHKDYAPAGWLDEATTIEPGAAIDVTMSEGVRVELGVTVPGAPEHVSGLRIRLIHEPSLHPSSIIGDLPELGADGKLYLTLAEGKYSFLALAHPDYIVTPSYSETVKPFELRRGAENRFAFQLQPKVNVRGRVVNNSSGKPESGCSVFGQASPGIQDGPFSQFASNWSDVDGSATDDRGEFELKLPPGRVRVRASPVGGFARPEFEEIEVATDGSSIVPDIHIQPIPKVRGVIRDQHGNPVPRAVVRFRDSDLFWDGPVVSDARGRFELSPDHLPADLLSDKRKPLQTIVAFDPYAPVGAKAVLSFTDPKSFESLTLQLGSQGYDFPVNGFPGERDGIRQGVSDEVRNSRALLSRGGQIAPELDGAAWLNADKPTMSLADFRGKYVLLQFWTTWCGPCHRDMPILKLAHDLYKDKDLVIIGVHDNSTPIDAIKQDVAAQKLPYPIVVDHQDGRILSAYKPLGVTGYPTYFLIAPNGSIVGDPTGTNRGLRIYMLEILRQQLMARKDKI
jgi:thiol-disulfide isomerase/thioredoxin